jgi:hypothetical protein
MTFTKPFYIFVFAEAEHYPGLRNIPEKCLRIISNTQSVDRWGHFSSHNGYVLLTFQVFLSRASALDPQANEAVQSCPKKRGLLIIDQTNANMAVSNSLFNCWSGEDISWWNAYTYVYSTNLPRGRQGRIFFRKKLTMRYSISNAYLLLTLWCCPPNKCSN